MWYFYWTPSGWRQRNWESIILTAFLNTHYVFYVGGRPSNFPYTPPPVIKVLKVKKFTAFIVVWEDAAGGAASQLRTNVFSSDNLLWQAANSNRKQKAHISAQFVTLGTALGSNTRPDPSHHSPVGISHRFRRHSHNLISRRANLLHPRRTCTLRSSDRLAFRSTLTQKGGNRW